MLSVSVDIQGPEVVKPYIKGTTFKTVVDPENVLANLFGFTVVPNGIFVSEDGTIQLVKQGFHVSNQEHVEAVEKLIRNEAKFVELDDVYYDPKKENSKVEKQLSSTKFKLAMEYVKQGRKDESLKELDEALLLDQDNFLIRKQRWYIRYPEKFSPIIDIDWQKQQLELEKSYEENCGPDGCEIPGT